MPTPRLLREPLLHFLAIGALLFALDAWVNGAGASDPSAIIVDQAQANALAVQFERTWQRPPTQAELRQSIDAWIEDELLYREGLSAGLDREDEVVRRRVANRMASLNEGMAAAVPQDAELQAWLRTHPGAYRIAPRYSLQQVYFDPRRRGARLHADVEAARVLLSRVEGAVPGDVTLLPAHVDAMAADDLVTSFGSAFVHALDRAPIGEWSGPIASSFGTHLVRLNARTPARLPPLADVREEVERDWLRDRTRRADRAYLAALRKHYKIELDADLAQAIADNGQRIAADGAP
ncbi:peptidyl-prolyl cis-trans isomerase [Noviluteimonas gilva]|uniref:peptidylprolyl isomerase n=1 Tax=Noviluteimonas gilva TaxID=2682097 RepID=A0A7C9HV36_9GAMM|nr:peptidylprolyl isomerase [Lysobacter gilvus]MUV15733.1 peptidyl-prolyl cis-trans isomerase [Lysobacter gilvus]